MDVATFAAGCFWGVEARFSALPGVVDTAVGYMGGHLADPSYQDVCSDSSGHAEVVQVTFDPRQTDYDALLALFWQIHDPTTLNRQGPDRGSQYRSAIFYHSELQQQLAGASLLEQSRSGRWPRAIVTQVVAAGPFYRAEEYHQQYFAKRGGGHCHG